MNNSYIPAVFKEKLVEIFGWFKGSIYLLLSITLKPITKQPQNMKWHYGKKLFIPLSLSL